MGSDAQYAKWPLLPLAQHVFTLTNPYASRPAQQAALQSLQDAISEHKMAPLYRYLAHPQDGILNATGEGSASAGSASNHLPRSGVPTGKQKPLRRSSSLVGSMVAGGGRSGEVLVSLPWDETLYAKLKEQNEEEVESFKKEEEEAVEKAGETEVQAARGKRADFWARVGDKVSCSCRCCCRCCRCCSRQL
jgi:26S proteasome regulatory subunit N7